MPARGGAAASGASTPSPPGALTWGRVGSHPGAPTALPWVPLLRFKLWPWSCEFPSSRPGTVRGASGLFGQDQTHGLRRTEAVERRDEHHVALPQGQEFGPRCYSWPCPGCSSLFPGFFGLRSGNLAHPRLLGDLWGWQLSPPASASVLEAEPSPEPRGRCSQAGFWLSLYSWQGRASDFHSAWVGCEQGLCHFGRLSPAATGDLGNLGRNIAISASVSQPHCPVARAAAASCSLGVGRAAASRGFVLCPALKVSARALGRVLAGSNAEQISEIYYL